jgi:hypothetical protein
MDEQSALATIPPHRVFQSDKERECASKAAAEVEERSRALKNKTM